MEKILVMETSWKMGKQLCHGNILEKSWNFSTAYHESCTRSSDNSIYFFKMATIQENVTLLHSTHLQRMQYECRCFENIQCITEMLSFPDMYDTLCLDGNTYFIWIVKRECRSKNCVLFENVFFVSHVINRRSQSRRVQYSLCLC